MTDLAHVTRPRSLPPLAAVVLALTVFLLALPAALVAIALGLGLLQLPYPLYLVLLRLPLLFPLHMIASGLALILIPIAAFTRHWRGIHRAAGRLAIAAVVVGGITALPVALASEATMMARAGLFVQGVSWLALAAFAVAGIRRGDVGHHARFMLAMAAVASGAIWLRVVTAVAAAAGLPFETVYALAAWACWLVPLGFAAVAGNRLGAAAQLRH
jgi:Predicted membrane protein (DUF2306)